MTFMPCEWKDDMLFCEIEISKHGKNSEGRIGNRDTGDVFMSMSSAPTEGKGGSKLAVC